MEQPSETKSKKFGRVLGNELKGFAKLVAPRNTEPSQASREVGPIGKKYEEATGRDSKYDGRVAALVGLTTAGVIGAGLLIAAASHVVVTGLILAAGTAGVAGCCKLTGHDEEYNQIVQASTTAVHTVVKSTKDFGGGIMEGLHNVPNTTAVPNPTAPGPSGYVRVDGDSPSASPHNDPAVNASNAAVPLTSTNNTGSSPPFPHYPHAPAPGAGPLYPPVYAPAPPAADPKNDLIDLNDSPAKP